MEEGSLYICRLTLHLLASSSILFLSHFPTGFRACFFRIPMWAEEWHFSRISLGSSTGSGRLRHAVRTEYRILGLSVGRQPLLDCLGHSLKAMLINLFQHTHSHTHILFVKLHSCFLLCKELYTHTLIELLFPSRQEAGEGIQILPSFHIC